MNDLDLAALAESLRETTLNLQAFIDAQADTLAAPRIRAAEQQAQAARDEQAQQATWAEQRFNDVRDEFRRQLAARDKTIKRLEADAAETKRAIRAVEALHVWTNEDGKQFVFADDLWAALADVSYNAHVATESKMEN